MNGASKVIKIAREELGYRRAGYQRGTAYQRRGDRYPRRRGKLFQHLCQRHCGGSEGLLPDCGYGEHQHTGNQFCKLQLDR